MNRKWALLFVGLFIASPASAQFNYIRTSFTGTYTPISTGGGATAITFANGDDGTTSIPLPFAFTYAGSGFGTSNFLAVCTNGYAFFSPSSVTSPNSALNVRLYDAIVPNTKTVAPWWDDLSIAAVGTNPAASVLYQTQGTPGTQTLTVQWTNVSSWFSTTSGGVGQPRQINFRSQRGDT